MAHPASQNPALDIVAAAFAGLERRVHRQHGRVFQDTTLQDVWIAVGEVEKRLAAKAQSRGLRRLKPLLDGLEHYSKAIEVLCNGTPYLPWIWAPIKLCIQIASDHIIALEKLVKAYEDIGKTLPRFDLLNQAFKQHPEFQQVLAVFYSDILEFHQQAYKVFNDSAAWKRFFDSTWTRFDQRFSVVLDSLRRHSDLVDKEANALNISTVQEWRIKAFDELEKAEKERLDNQFRAALAWFDVKGYQQDDILNSLNDKCHPGSATWFFSNTEVNAWMSDAAKNPVLWITGKPGSGKSVLCAQLIQHLRHLNKNAVAFYICSLRTNKQYGLDQALRSIAARLVQHSRDHATFVYREYILKGDTPSVSVLKQLVPALLSGMPGCRLIIDGLDECTQPEQEEMLKGILPFATTKSTNNDCKIIVFSQDVGHIRRSLKKHTCISLSDQGQFLEESIRSFVVHELAEVRLSLDDMEVPEDVMATVERKLISKADGMFLWARLVLSSLKNSYSVNELQTAVDNLPHGIQEAYGRILDHFNTNLPKEHFSTVRRIFSWLLVTDRPLKVHEILDGVTFCTPPHTLDDDTKLRRQTLDLCKPLLEISPEGTVSIVHFSANQFLMDPTSGPFIAQDQALSNVTLACVSYVKFSMNLVDGRVTDIERVRSVIKGFHGLHTFAYAHWLTHLVRLTEIGGGVDKSGLGSRLEHAVKALCERYQMLSVAFSQHTERSSHAPLGHEMKTRASVFSSYEPLQALAVEVWEADENQAEGQENSEDDNKNLKQTLFHQSTVEYESIMNRLMSPDGAKNYPELEPLFPDFRAFQTTRPFTCTFPTCPRRSDGFSSIEERNEHEAFHRPRLMCSENSCQFSKVLGFSSKAQLNRHTRKYHPTGPRSIPAFPWPRLDQSTRDEDISVDLSGHQTKSGATSSSAEHNSDNGTDPHEISNRLSTLDLDALASEHKQIGKNWHAVFNPTVTRELEFEEKHTFLHDSVVTKVCFSKDGKRIATASNRAVLVFDAATGERLARMRQDHLDAESDMYYRDVCFLPDSRFLLTGDESNTLHIWDTKTCEIHRTFQGHKEDIYSVDVSADGKHIVSGSGDRRVILWQVDTGDCVMDIETGDGIVAVCFSPDDLSIATGSLDKRLKIYPITPGPQVSVDNALCHLDSVYDVSWSSQTTILTASLDKTVKIWQVSNGLWKCTNTLRGPIDFMLTVRSSINTRWIIGGSKDRGVYIWDASTGVAHAMVLGHKNSVISVATSRQDLCFATCSGDMTVKVWKLGYLNEHLS